MRPAHYLELQPLELGCSLASTSPYAPLATISINGNIWGYRPYPTLCDWVYLSNGWHALTVNTAGGCFLCRRGWTGRSEVGCRHNGRSLRTTYGRRRYCYRYAISSPPTGRCSDWDADEYRPVGEGGFFFINVFIKIKFESFFFRCVMFVREY